MSLRDVFQRRFPSGVPLSLLLALSAVVILIVAVLAVDPFDWFGQSREDGEPDRIVSQSGKRDGLKAYERAEKDEPKASEEGPWFDYGTVKGIPPDTNPNVKSVVEAIKTGKNPERLSPFIHPKPFDKKKFEENPQAYLDILEPGRVFQSAQPGKGIPVLRPVGNTLFPMEQGDTVTLKVRAPAGSPVTFTAMDLGAFENLLPSITVQADKRGIAKVNYTATPGTINNCTILSGCPLATDQVKFTMDIRLPASRAVKAPMEKSGP